MQNTPSKIPPLLSHLEQPNKQHPYRIILRQYNDNTLIEEHKHNLHQGIICKTGFTLIFLEHQLFVVPPNHIFIIPKNRSHTSFFNSKSSVYSIYWQSTDVINEGLYKCSKLLFELTTTLHHQSHCANNEHKHYIKALNTLFKYELQLSSHEQTLAPNIAQMPLPQDKRIRKICEQYIYQHPNKATLQQLCEQAGISISSAKRLFKKELSMSFNEWKKNYYLLKLEQLKQHHMTIQELSYELGFSSTSGLYKLLKNTHSINNTSPHK